MKPRAFGIPFAGVGLFDGSYFSSTIWRTCTKLPAVTR